MHVYISYCNFLAWWTGAGDFSWLNSGTTAFLMPAPWILATQFFKATKTEVQTPSKFNTLSANSRGSSNPKITMGRIGMDHSSLRAATPTWKETRWAKLDPWPRQSLFNSFMTQLYCLIPVVGRWSCMDDNDKWSDSPQSLYSIPCMQMKLSLAEHLLLVYANDNCQI